MENKEVALQLTMKAMETGLIASKPLNHCSGDDPFEEAAQHAIKQVTGFYRAALIAVIKGTN